MSPDAPKDFLRQIVAEDVAKKTYDGRVHTRFPPEPNGYLHIGHAKSICLNFGIARDYEGGRCNLRFDDTDPTKESVEYVDAIKRDIEWLGFEWDGEFYASDYFEQLYDWAVQLIKDGKAFVCDQTEEEIRATRGTVTRAGTNSPFRERAVDENLALFTRMRAGEFKDGERVVRAKIDMASPNMKMRDPLMYRIRHAHHYRQGDKWCIYPLYDFTHGQSDSIENITHSLCSLEFENNRELYDWYVQALGIYAPHQYEFARLNLSYTVMSKRKLLRLVNEGHVAGWDDPRMPTICGLRRRGFTPESIRDFCDRVGVGRSANTVELESLESAVRDDLNPRTARRMAVLRPLKVIIDNYPDDGEDVFDAVSFPDDPPKMGTRKVPFAKELYIEQSDFMEAPPKKFFRLAPGREVRLRWAYLVTCVGVDKDESGEVTAVHCTYDPETRGGSPPDGRKVKGTIHWVSAKHAVDAQVRLYETLFNVENPNVEEDDQDFTSLLNPDSLETLSGCKLEPSLEGTQPGVQFQFERHGYFCADPDTTDAGLVFNRTVSLRDSWARIMKKSGGA